MHPIDEGKIDKGSVLIVESLDRLSRQAVLKAQNQLNRILEAGVEVVTLTDSQRYSLETISENPFSLIMSLLVMIRANEESQIKSKRLKAAWKNKRANITNKKMTSTCPSWLTLDESGENFVVDEEKAKIVKSIFDMCIDGFGIFSITRILNDTVKPIGGAKTWHTSYVTKILHNEAVMGEFKLHHYVEGKRTPTGEVISDYFPEIIDADRFKLAQARIASRKNKRGAAGKTVSNLFSNICFCGKCGEKVVFKNKGKPPKGFTYLRCENSVTSSKCDCSSWRYDDFENSFAQFVSEISFDSIFEKKNSNEINDLKNELIENEDILLALDAEYDVLIDGLGKIPAKNEVLFDRVLAKSENLNAEIERVKNRISELNIKISEMEVENKQKDQVELVKLFQDVSELSDDEKFYARTKMKEIIKRNVASITLYNGAKVIPQEWFDLPKWLGNEIVEMGHDSEEKIEKFLAGRTGKRWINKVTRMYEVKFRNGVTRYVWPYRGLTFAKDDKRNENWAFVFEFVKNMGT